MIQMGRAEQYGETRRIPVGAGDRHAVSAKSDRTSYGRVGSLDALRRVTAPVNERNLISPAFFQMCFCEG